MLVRDVMTHAVRLVRPNETIEQAASTMAEIDAGLLPLTDDDRMIGMITDRDIAVRAVARGLGPDTKVSEVMTTDVKYCFDDEAAEDVAENMGDIQVRRLPVLDRDKRLVGIVSLGDIATTHESPAVAHALSGISEPGGQHSQTGSQAFA
jgi:CBS domain-containing protein